MIGLCALRKKKINANYVQSFGFRSLRWGGSNWRELWRGRRRRGAVDGIAKWAWVSTHSVLIARIQMNERFFLTVLMISQYSIQWIFRISAVFGGNFITLDEWVLESRPQVVFNGPFPATSFYTAGSLSTDSRGLVHCDVSALKRFCFWRASFFFLFCFCVTCLKRFPRVQSSNSLFFTPRKKSNILLSTLNWRRCAEQGFHKRT